MSALRTALYGQADHDLAPAAPDAVQLSPLLPGSTDIASIPDESFTAVTVRAPPGAVERRFVLAHALRILAPNGRLTAFAPKDRGGLRLKKELEALGCEVGESARRHNRICLVVRPAAIIGLDEAIALEGNEVLTSRHRRHGKSASGLVDRDAAGALEQA